MRPNRCDEILRLIDEALADYERDTTRLHGRLLAAGETAGRNPWADAATRAGHLAPAGR